MKITKIDLRVIMRRSFNFQKTMGLTKKQALRVSWWISKNPLPSSLYKS
jgi:hypothetical protein